jgi:hypothetical protein
MNMDKEQKLTLCNALAGHVVNEMDLDALIVFTIETLEESYLRYTDEFLLAQVKEFAPHLLDEGDEA